MVQLIFIFQKCLINGLIDKNPKSKCYYFNVMVPLCRGKLALSLKKEAVFMNANKSKWYTVRRRQNGGTSTDTPKRNGALSYFVN